MCYVIIHHAIFFECHRLFSIPLQDGCWPAPGGYDALGSVLLLFFLIYFFHCVRWASRWVSLQLIYVVRSRSFLSSFILSFQLWILPALSSVFFFFHGSPWRGAPAVGIRGKLSYVHHMLMKSWDPTCNGFSIYIRSSPLLIWSN